MHRFGDIATNHGLRTFVVGGHRNGQRLSRLQIGVAAQANADADGPGYVGGIQVDIDGYAGDKIAERALRGEPDDDGGDARARQKRRTHGPQYRNEMSIKNQHDDPAHRRGDLLQETDGGAVDVTLASHRRVERASQYA